MKKILTKAISLLAIAAVSATVLLGTPLGDFNGMAAEVSAASTESEVLSAINKLANGDYGAEYKAGNYWNTKVTSACPRNGYEHSSTSYDKSYSILVNGSTRLCLRAIGSSNYYTSTGSQCAGFAYAVFDKLFGDGKSASGDNLECDVYDYPASGYSSKKDWIIKTAKVGDLVYIHDNTSSGWGHWFIYTGKYDNTYLYCYDANGYANGGTCKIALNDSGNRRSWEDAKLKAGNATIYHKKNYTLTIGCEEKDPQDEHYIVDKNYSGSDPKNIRASKSSSSALLGTIPKNTVCWVTEISGSGSNKWGKVTYNNITGYINLYYSVTTGDHQWSSWSTAKAATCTDTGTEKRSCGCGKTEERSIAATGHKYKDEVVPPTPTSEGYTKHSCTVCGYSYTDSRTPATGPSGTIRMDNVSAVRGQTVKIPVYIDDVKIMGISMDVKFDPAVLKYKGNSDKVFELAEENTDNASKGTVSIVCANTSNLVGGKIIVLNFEVVASKAVSTKISVTSSDATDGEKQVALKSAESTVNISSVLLGDVTGEGKVTTQDAIWVLQSIAKKRTLTAEQLAAADVTGEGNVTTQDAIWILQSIVGKRTF